MDCFINLGSHNQGPTLLFGAVITFFVLVVIINLGEETFKEKHYTSSSVAKFFKNSWFSICVIFLFLHWLGVPIPFNLWLLAIPYVVLVALWTKRMIYYSVVGGTSLVLTKIGRSVMKND